MHLTQSIRSLRKGVNPAPQHHLLSAVAPFVETFLREKKREKEKENKSASKATTGEISCIHL